MNPAVPPTGLVPRSSRRAPAWRRALPWLLVFSIVVLILLGFRPRPIDIEPATVTAGSLTVSVLEEGKTRIRHRYLISSPVAGHLNRLELRPGSKTEAGKTVLAILDPLPASLLDPRTRAETEARIKMAQASESRAIAEVERTRAALELAQQQWRRLESLIQEKAISPWDADAARNLVVINERTLHAAEFAVQVAASERAQAQAALISTSDPSSGTPSMEPLKLLAPINGVVLSVPEESARNVTGGTALLELGDPSDLEIEVELLSSDAVTVRPGAEVSIEQWGGDKPLRGRVATIEPGGFTKISSLGVEEQRVKVRVDFVDPLSPDLPLGDRYRVEARIVTWTHPNVLRIPTGALFRRGPDWMTFVLEGNHPRLTKVEIDHQNGVSAEVRSGVKSGQSVILHPPDTVTEKTAIRAQAR